jgi:hypothetical protein
VTSKPSASRRTRRRSNARAELNRNTVGEQLPLAQQYTKTPEFESRVDFEPFWFGHELPPVRFSHLCRLS